MGWGWPVFKFQGWGGGGVHYGDTPHIYWGGGGGGGGWNPGGIM